MRRILIATTFVLAGVSAMAQGGGPAITTASIPAVDPGTTGNVLTSNGSAWTSAAPAAPATGSIKANMLQNAAADLGAADVTVNLGNTNGAYNTNVITDGRLLVGPTLSGTDEAFYSIRTKSAPAQTYTTIYAEDPASNNHIMMRYGSGEGTIATDGTLWVSGVDYIKFYTVDGAYKERVRIDNSGGLEIEDSTRNNVGRFSQGGATAAPSYDNIGGSRDRRTHVTITTTLTGGGTLDKLEDGITTYLGANPWFNTQTGGSVTWDFGAGASKVITEAKFYQSTTDSHGTWQWQGSNNGTDYTNIGATFTRGTAASSTETTMAANTTGYRYYRSLHTAGYTLASAYWNEFEFKIDDVPTASVNYLGIQQTITDGNTVGDIILNRAGGNVGVGKPPVTALDVSGSARATRVVATPGTLTTDDVTPDVSTATVWTSVANGGATAITDLDNPTPGVFYTLIVGSATNPISIADAGNFSLTAAWAPDSVGDNIVLYVNADNDYYEISRSNN